MDDAKILDLYFARSEQAIQETDTKYGGLCYRIAYNVLNCREDSEETVSDTYLTAWKRIPPTRPNVFSAFLSKITRNLAINRWKANRRQKRGGGQIDIALDELDDVADGKEDAEKRCESRELILAYNRFLAQLPRAQRELFLMRYFYLDPISKISGKTGYSESKVKSMLFRTRNKLRDTLEKEGYL